MWALVMVSLPINDWFAGWSAMTGAITVAVSATAGVVTALLWRTWGAAAALRAAGIILLMSWAAEVVGSWTGYPFGTYDYTDLLGPKILGVPIQIPLGWLMMLPPSWGVAVALSTRVNPHWRLPAVVCLSALAMTAWDLFLDPMMVSWGIWDWDHPGAYYGVPWTNFIGWLLVSALVTSLIRPGKVPVTPLLIIYTAVWLLKSVGLGIFWGMPGAAAIGTMFMGSITILAWHEFTRE